ncbi:MAG: hypothetical protein RQ743_06010 [Bacteroidales bacterium]|nr:hypothetical protein [Bacteroidales bacterium]
MKNNICPNCGVILDEGLDLCPLCRSKPEAEKNEKSELYPSDILHLSEKKSRIYTWELSAIIAFSANLICIIVDMVIGKGLGWSLYAVTSITGLWLFITSFTYLLKRPALLGTSLLVITLSMLIIFDLLAPPVSWFVEIGLPLSLSFWVLFALFLFILRRVKLRGFNVLAIVFVELSVFCIFIDIFSDLALRDKIFIDWSAIAAATLVPLAGVLFFIHYRMKRGKDLGSFFHV